MALYKFHIIIIIIIIRSFKMYNTWADVIGQNLDTIYLLKLPSFWIQLAVIILSYIFVLISNIII